MSEPFHEANERLRERKRIENDKDAEIERLTAELADCKESDRLIERLQARVEVLEGVRIAAEKLANSAESSMSFLAWAQLYTALAATEQEHCDE